MDKKIEGQIFALTVQRNEALDRCAMMNGTIAAMAQEINTLKEKLAKPPKQKKVPPTKENAT